jgi:hypothetical protein
MAAFKFYLQLDKQRKVGWVRVDSHVVFGQKFLGEKGSMGQCAVVIQRPVLLLSKFGANSLHFHAVAAKRRSNMRNWSFGLPGLILC